MVKKGGIIYRYVDIVEGYRREDGTVAQKIIARLGSMSEQAFKNLQAAFRAAHCGKSVVVSDKEAVNLFTLNIEQYLNDTTVSQRILPRIDTT